VVIPLVNVATHWRGRVINVSETGMKVHVEEAFLDRLPQRGDAYRVQTDRDVVLCEVCHCQVEDEGSNLGLRILHWGATGSLRLLLDAVGSSAPAESGSILGRDKNS